MGVRQGLGTLIKQRDNKAQIKKQRHPIKEKKIQRQSPINKKKQRHCYKKIHKQKRGSVWVKQTRRRRRRRGGGDDRIYGGYTENLAATKVVCSIWYIFQLAFFFFFSFLVPADLLFSAGTRCFHGYCRNNPVHPGN